MEKDMKLREESTPEENKRGSPETPEARTLKVSHDR
jgi:hypothetical protein